MTIKKKYPHLSESLYQFVFYVANGTLLIEKPYWDYRELVLKENLFGKLVNTWCSKIDFSEINSGTYLSIGRGYDSVKECLRNNSWNFHRMDNFLDEITDFAIRLSSGTLTGKLVPKSKESFEDLIFDSANMEIIFHLYLRLAVFENGKIINHLELCNEIGQCEDPNSDCGFDIFEIRLKEFDDEY